ncbi:MAG: hypothetical protein AAF602_28685 [Myxococcota bacterium]
MAQPARKQKLPTPTETSAPERDALDDVAARVRDDARRDPREYLRSTEVPGGGE